MVGYSISIIAFYCVLCFFLFGFLLIILLFNICLAGGSKFMAWRRGFSTRPPPVTSFSQFYPGNDERYV